MNDTTTRHVLLSSIDYKILVGSRHAFIIQWGTHLDHFWPHLLRSQKSRRVALNVAPARADLCGLSTICVVGHATAFGLVPGCQLACYFAHRWAYDVMFCQYRYMITQTNKTNRPDNRYTIHKSQLHFTSVYFKVPHRALPAPAAWRDLWQNPESQANVLAQHTDMPAPDTRACVRQSCGPIHAGSLVSIRSGAGWQRRLRTRPLRPSRGQQRVFTGVLVLHVQVYDTDHYTTHHAMHVPQ